MELIISDLQKICLPENIVITIHAAKRLEQRGIFLRDIINCVTNGESIEQYPDDYPYPRCLILGNRDTQKPLHTVIGTDGKQLWIVTAYYPAITKWEADLKTRKEQ